MTTRRRGETSKRRRRGGEMSRRSPGERTQWQRERFEHKGGDLNTRVVATTYII
jgi:hypothetical protein